MPNFNGLWTSRQQMQARGGNTWPSVPGAPTSPVATAGNASASVAFVAPADTGYPAGTIIGYRVTSTPGGFTGTGATSPVTVTGLTNGTAYTFTVAAQNVNGYGPESVASNSVTPALPVYIEDIFSTYLYTGNGGAQTITNGINLSGNGGMLWCKIRNTSDAHALFDTARSFPNWLASNTTGAQNAFGTPNAADMVATTTGFSMNNISSASNSWNSSGNTFASWAFRKQPKFFDVVTWTGNGSAITVNHNLGSVPGCIIIKAFSSSPAVGQNWLVYHRSVVNQGRLNSTDAFIYSGIDNVTSTSFEPSGTGSGYNVSGVQYIGYVFAHNAGGFGATGSDNVISCGSYTGNGSTTGPVVTLGYEPQWVLIKNASSAQNWYLLDNMRGMPVSTADANLIPNLSNAESDSTVLSPTSTGFQLNTAGSPNQNGDTFIYIAIRRGPMAVPTTGTSVFIPAAVTESGNTPTTTTGFPVDLIMNNYRAGNSNNTLFGNRLSAANALVSSSTAAEIVSAFYSGGLWDSNTTSTGNYAGSGSVIKYFLRRAPSFMDTVFYTGTGGASQTFTHNLGVAPELVIVKNRDAAAAWESLGTALSASQRQLYLNRTQAGVAVASGHLGWNGTDGAYKAPTSSVVYFGGDSDVGGSNVKYVAHLFATCAGVSKVGTYTGTGATQTIACGFAAGARWVMIKRTDTTGDWYVWDTVRGMVAGTDPSILLNGIGAEVNTNSVYTITTGFQIVSTAAGINASGGTYIFLAIA